MIFEDNLTTVTAVIKYVFNLVLLFCEQIYLYQDEKSTSFSNFTI